MTPKRWFQNGNRWAHLIVYVRTARDPQGYTYAQPYTKYTLVVHKHSWRSGYQWYVYDGSVLDGVLASGFSRFRWLAQFRAGWAVPS